jgi:signal transduction histidine kinase
MEENTCILIVDDQESAREVLKGLLLGQGYNLALAGDGEEALLKAAELLPDLILLDVMMPGLDGFEVCQQIRNNPLLAEMPIVMVTALDDFESRMRGLEVGVDDFLTKPVQKVELTARVKSIVRLNRYRRLLQERNQRQRIEQEIQQRNLELKQVKHQEQEKQAALDRLRHTFLSTINHELRTPLALIFQTIEMLESANLGELNEGQLDALTALRRQSRTLGQMVESLTRVAAFVSKQEPVKPVKAQLKPIFENVIALAEFKARTKGIEIETELEANLPVLHLDIKQIEEALTQLVDNAIKFNQKDGKVKLSAWSEKDWVAVAVADTGIGIEPAQTQIIWDIFEQGVDPLRRAQEGLGLGLVLTRHIIEAHHGLIELETTPGQGSIFTIRLPRPRENSGQHLAWLKMTAV